VRRAIRLKHYSIRTEEAYTDWIRRFILFHGKRHPKDMAEPEVSAFLSDLATEGHVAASTQNQALSALLFLYKEVLKKEIGWLEKLERARKKKKLPVVLNKTEIDNLSVEMFGGGVRTLNRMQASNFIDELFERYGGRRNGNRSGSRRYPQQQEQQQRREQAGASTPPVVRPQVVTISSSNSTRAPPSSSARSMASAAWA